MINTASKNRSGRNSPDSVSHDGFSVCSRSALLMDARKAAVKRLATNTEATTSSMDFSEMIRGELYTTCLKME